jgi:hypothetical protein
MNLPFADHRRCCSGEHDPVMLSIDAYTGSEKIKCTITEDAGIEGNSDSPCKPSRQQLRAMEREKRNAAGWISALGTDEPWLRQANRVAIGTRSITRAELEEALGMSLAPNPPRQERSSRSSRQAYTPIDPVNLGPAWRGF